MPTNYNFSDVFVSYSRKDSDFVRHLSDSLIALEYEIWVDWEDIPHTADWWAEIQAGIAAANTFLFVISPHSANSSVCRDEVEYAVQSNKRVVPILREELADEDVALLHPVVRTHNWLSFTDDSNFDVKLAQLLEALTTNLEHVRKHTRYLVRAREWNEHERDDSYLLRGADASDAADWLQASESEQPAPLILHQAYILACIEQLRKDDALQQQYVAVQFIERRSWPAFFMGLLVGTVYFLLTFPEPYPNYEFIHRLGFSLGAGAVFGVVLGALSLYTDELTAVRFAEQPMLRFLAAAFYGLLFGAVGFGILQAIYFGTRLDYFSILGGGFSVALIFILRSVFRLYGFRAFLLGAGMLFIVINLFSATPERIWNDPRVPIFWFRDATQQLLLSAFMAICISLSVTGWEMVEPHVLRFMRQRILKQKETQPLA